MAWFNCGRDRSLLTFLSRACMYLLTVLLLIFPIARTLPKGLVSPEWMDLKIWKSCENMPCVKGYVCVMHKAPEYTGPLCVVAGISTCMNVKCTAGFDCIHEEVICKKAPCFPQPRCVPDEEQGSYKVPTNDMPPPEDVPCVLPCPLHQTCRHVGGDPTCVPYNNGEDACSHVKCEPTTRCSLRLDGNAQCIIDDGSPESITPSDSPDQHPVGCSDGYHQAETLDGPRCIPDVLPPPPPGGSY